VNLRDSKDKIRQTFWSPEEGGSVLSGFCSLNHANDHNSLQMEAISQAYFLTRVPEV
jgi:hypothetical protein